LRSSQFQPGVTRVVVDLVRPVEYVIEEDAGGVRISFPNPSGAFEAWSTAAAPRRVAPAQDAREPMGRAVADAPADRRTTTVPVSRPAVIEAPQQPQQPVITVEFRNTPITDVIGTFADFSGRSIVPGQGVAGQTITAAIQGQPWDEALRAILGGQGLTATELPSGIIMVTSRQQQRELETQEEMVTEAFQLQYVSADSVAPQVRQLLAQGDQAVGNVAVNRATNSVIVSARQSVVDRLRNLVPSLDQRTPQVTIQVRILTVRRSDLQRYGVRYELRDSHAPELGGIQPTGEGQLGQDQVSITGNAISAIGNAAEEITGATFDVVTTLLIGRHALITWIDAIERLELAELQADPVVTVLDHRTARVHVGERTPIRVVDQGSAGANGPQAQVRTEETGVIVELTPHVVGTNQVLVNLHAERSQITSFSADAGYVFGTQETDTEILLNDGQTAVISGLTTKDLTTTLQGIPILMHLPWIGGLFRNTTVQEDKEDLLIMVTPYIDRSGGF
jgi:type IV pilus assembly protein PilQ